MPGTYLKVVSKYSPAKDLHIIHLREEIPPFPLINRPFVEEETHADESIVEERKGEFDRLLQLSSYLILGPIWLYPQFNDKNEKSIKRLHQIEQQANDPPGPVDQRLLRHVRGALFGLAIGEALGCPVENQTRDYLVKHPCTDMTRGGAHGLEIGQVSEKKRHDW